MVPRHRELPGGQGCQGGLRSVSPGRQAGLRAARATRVPRRPRKKQLGHQGGLMAVQPGWRRRRGPSQLLWPQALPRLLHNDRWAVARPIAALPASLRPAPPVTAPKNGRPSIHHIALPGTALALGGRPPCSWLASFSWLASIVPCPPCIESSLGHAYCGLLLFCFCKHPDAAYNASFPVHEHASDIPCALPILGSNTLLRLLLAHLGCELLQRDTLFCMHALRFGPVLAARCL